MRTFSRLFYASLACWLSISSSALAADPESAPEQPLSAVERAELTVNVLNDVLVAEIAKGRGDQELSWQAYMDAARKSADPRLAERALDAALSLDQEQAIDDAGKLLLSVAPESERALLLTVIEHLSNGRIEAARQTLDRVLKNTQDPALAFARLASQTTGVMSPDQRYYFLSDAAKAYDDNAELQLTLARTAAQAQLTRLIKGHIDKAVAAAPEDMRVLLEGADIEFSVDPSTTTRRLQAFLKQHPDNSHVRLAYARSLIQTGSRGELAEQLRLLNMSNGRSAHMQLQLGMIAEEARLFEEAKFHYRKSLVYIAQNPSSKLTVNTVYVRLGMVALSQNKKLEAIDWFAKVEEGDNYVAAHVKRAEILASMNRIEDACTALRSIQAESDKQTVDLSRACAELYLRANRLRDAVLVLQEAIETAPDNSELIYRTAMLAERADMVTTAETLFKRFISLKPQDAQGYNSLGYMWLSRNQHIQEAAVLIEKAMYLSDGVDPYILDSMGWLKYRQGDLEAAEQYLRRAQHIQPDTEVLLHLAQVLFAAGKKHEAEAIVRSVLKDSPNNAEALSILKVNGINL